MERRHGEPHTQPGNRRSTLLNEAEWQLVVRSFNQTTTPYPSDKLIHELFEAQVKRTPEAVAVISEGYQLTYSQLNRKANEIAHTLREYGVHADERVALLAERSPESIVGQLAILKAGGAYVPLDPNYQSERLNFMLRDSEPLAVLGEPEVIGRISTMNLPVVMLDLAGRSQKVEDLDADGLSSRNLAYVIYTSGSTGRPKGVMVEHRSVLRLVFGMQTIPIGPQDCVAHCSSPSFDVSTWEVWPALLSGARVLAVPQSTLLSALDLNRLLVSHKVTAMCLTVGLFNEYVDALEQAFAGMSHLLIGGEAVVPSIVARALSKRRSPKHMVNAYGPTEATFAASMFSIASVTEAATSIPIGSPIGNTSIYILDSKLQPVPIGMTGEVFIGGPGVARCRISCDWTRLIS